LRVPGVAYEHLPVDDRNAALTEVLTGALQRATAAGIPVPLYAGGNTSGGLARAVPRHVVLLLPPSAVVSAPASAPARIYEPAGGRACATPPRQRPPAEAAPTSLGRSCRGRADRIG